MTRALDASDLEVRDALITRLHDEVQFWDLEPLRSWAAVSLASGDDAPQNAWSIIERHLSDPALSDPPLLAAGWLLGLRGNTAADVERDARLPVDEVLKNPRHQVAPQEGMGTRRLVAAACLLNSAEWAQQIQVRKRAPNPASVFQRGKASTPAEKLVAFQLLVAAEDWFEKDGQTAPDGLQTSDTAEHRENADRPAGYSHLVVSSRTGQRASHLARARNWRTIFGAAILVTFVGMLSLLLPGTIGRAPASTGPRLKPASSASTHIGNSSIPPGFPELKLAPGCAQHDDSNIADAFYVAHMNGCWVDSTRTSDGEVLYALVVHKNVGRVREDDVTARLDLPPGVTLISGSTYWASANEPTTAFVDHDDIVRNGVNVGSYLPGANVWWLFALHVQASSMPKCGASISNAIIARTVDGSRVSTTEDVRVSIAACSSTSAQSQ